jgi:putative ABC transport system permease protein
MMQLIVQDARYAVRTLRKIPAFTVTAVLTLAMAIGASSALFSIVNGVLLAPLPYAEPERLVVIHNTYNGKPAANSVPDYMDRVRGSATLESTAAVRARDYSMTLAASSVHISGAAVTANFFDVLGVRPMLGTTFTPGNGEAGADNVIVLSHAAWRQYFGGDPQAVGQSVTIDGVSNTLIGVMPEGFRMPIRDADLWKPLTFTAAQFNESERGNESLTNLARTKQGIEVAQVKADMQQLAAIAVQNAGPRRQFLENAKFSADVGLLFDETVGSVRKPLLVLLGATSLVLFIALANVANLLLARCAGRKREMFIRVAVGATRRRVVSQLLLEGLILAAAGGMAGVTAAYWAVRLWSGLQFTDVPRLNDVAVDGRVLAFALLLTMLTGIAFSALPAWITSRFTYGQAAAGSRGAESSGATMRQLAVVLQVAIAQVLLVGAVLLVVSLDRLLAVDPGFQTDSRLTMRVSLPAALYPSAEARAGFFNTLTERLSGMAGVQQVGLSSLAPFDVQNHTATFHVEGYEEGPGSKPLGSEIRFITGGYPAAIGIPLLAGRTFNERDRSGSPLVVLVDKRTAEQFWPGQNPLGKRLRFGTAWREVVGVAGTVKNERLDADDQYQIYIPYYQFPEASMIVAVHARMDVASAANELRRIVAELDRNVPVFDMRPLQDRVQQSLSTRRYSTVVLAGFGVAALLVTIVGIYGLVAYSVQQREAEIGIRMALGAQRRQIIRLMVQKGVLLAAGGVGLGLVGAFWLTRFLDTLLYNVAATEPSIFMLVGACLVGAGLLASFLPASRASRLNPVNMLLGRESQSRRVSSRTSI